jgi:4-amino-4-deoxy-L-arabinose transferase-like glycosyltransferase
VKRISQFLTSPAGLFGICLALRLVFMVVLNLTQPDIPSGHIKMGHETGRIGIHIAQGLGFSSPLKFPSGPTAWITPIYPYLVAAASKTFGIETVRAFVAMQVLNNVFSALVCFPLFAIGRRLFGTQMAVAGVLMWILYIPAFYWPTAWIWDTSLAALAVTLLLWATYEMEDTDKALRWAGYGGLWAFAALVNAAVVSILPGLFAYCAYRARKRGAPWLRLTAIAALAFAVGISPWVIRNEIVFHGKVFMRSNFGLELWLGNNPEAPGTWTPWLQPNDNDTEGRHFAEVGELAYMQEKKQLAMEFIKSHPGDVMHSLFHRFIENWTGTDEPIADVFLRLPWWAQGWLAMNCVFSLLTCIGLLFARRAEPVRYAPLFILILFFPAIYYVTHNTPRYRHPIEPAMSLLVVYAVAQIVRALRERRTAHRESQIAAEPAS